MLARRKLLAGLLTGIIAAPMVVRDYCVLMPVRDWLTPQERELLANGFTYQNGVWRKQMFWKVEPAADAPMFAELAA